MLNAIKDIINPDIVLNIETESNTLTLKESAPDSKIKKLHIKSVPENTFAFTLDYQPRGYANRFFKQLSCYVDIRNKKGINKGCDLVLVIPQTNYYVVLLFELKSKKPDLDSYLFFSCYFGKRIRKPFWFWLVQVRFYRSER